MTIGTSYPSTKQYRKSFMKNRELPFRRNKNLGNIIGRHTLKNNKIVSSNNPNQGKCQPCLSRRNNLCCKQMTTTTEFTNRKTGRQFKIYHNVNCKSFYVIYLIECILCHFKPSGNVKQYLI